MRVDGGTYLAANRSSTATLVSTGRRATVKEPPRWCAARAPRMPPIVGRRGALGYHVTAGLGQEIVVLSYLYLILDLYSRKIVGFEVHDTESGTHSQLVKCTALADGVHGLECKPVLHGNNGRGWVKGVTLLDVLYFLGISPS